MPIRSGCRLRRRRSLLVPDSTFELALDSHGTGVRGVKEVAERWRRDIVLGPSVLRMFEDVERFGALPSELEFQQKLELTWRSHSYRSCIQRQIYPAKVGSRNEAIWVSKLRPVENVEHLGPELELYLFCDRKAFGEPPIRLHEARTAQEIAGDVAESGGAGTTWIKRVFRPRGAKSRWVESPAGQIQRLAGN